MKAYSFLGCKINIKNFAVIKDPPLRIHHEFSSFVENQMEMGDMVKPSI